MVVGLVNMRLMKTKTVETMTSMIFFLKTRKACSSQDEARSYLSRAALFVLLFTSANIIFAEPQAAERVYHNNLKVLDNPGPLLADYPSFVEPVVEERRYEAPTLVNEPDADLSVRAWRFSYNARGI